VRNRPIDKCDIFKHLQRAGLVADEAAPAPLERPAAVEKRDMQVHNCTKFKKKKLVGPGEAEKNVCFHILSMFHWVVAELAPAFLSFFLSLSVTVSRKKTR
jgi:hypothetical protein